MSFTTAVKTCFAKYATFSGRAARSEYWWFFLFVFLISAFASLLDDALFGVSSGTEAGEEEPLQPIQGMLSLAVLLPYLAVSWRRMHDTGRSGLYALFPLLLFATAIAVLVFGIGIADLFVAGGSMDILFTRLTLLLVIPTLIVLLVSPLLMLWWLTRPSQAGTNTYGPNPKESGA